MLLTNDHGANDSLLFARKRLDELKKLNGGHLGGASNYERQPLIQEFFFHLVGAIDKLMQTINESKLLGITPCLVTANKVKNLLPRTDPLRALVEPLHPDTLRSGCWLPLPATPYTDEWNHFRIMVFRNWVNHYGENPFAMRIGAEPPISLFIDPRNPELGGSKLHAFDELELFWKLVADKCKLALEAL